MKAHPNAAGRATLPQTAVVPPAPAKAAVLDNAQVPLYIQLADLFRQRIARGYWPKGEKLPSLEKLGAEFQVARVTVRQAIDRLTRDGLVSPQRGRGTFVTGAPQDNRWLRVETTLQSLADVYRDTQPTILNIDESATRRPLVYEADGVAAEHYVYMRRIHAHQGRPYCVIDIYLDAAIFALDPARFRAQTVIPLLMEMPAVKIVAARQLLKISTADLEVARHLGIRVNAPVAEVRRVFTGPKRRVIYLGEVTYRGDFVHMEIDLKA
jgi:GntR family transcriptional regulator